MSYGYFVSKQILQVFSHFSTRKEENSEKKSAL